MSEVVETGAQPNSTVVRGNSFPDSFQGRGPEGAVGSSGFEAFVQQAPVVSLGKGESANAQVRPVNVEQADTQGPVHVNTQKGVQGINTRNGNIAEEVLKQPSIMSLVRNAFRRLHKALLGATTTWSDLLKIMNGQKPPTPTPA